MNVHDILARKSEILQRSSGLDYGPLGTGNYGVDYQQLMASTGYTLDDVRRIQNAVGVGRTPMIELRNITQIVRLHAKPGCGARIFLKDEAANPSGSFKDRRASLPVYHAVQHGYPGVLAATSGNYGAAVACQAAKYNLPAIVIQETFDSSGLGQPEILEKGRRCRAFGAEVMQLSVGPELFAVSLATLEETGYFNGSLYTPFAVQGVETLGWEIAADILELTGRQPTMVVVTHAGGGNLTGTARGLQAAGADKTQLVAVSVDLQGLHMASDKDFNRKSFTTGHTGFGIPFATWPDRSDVPYNAARPLRYMDAYYTVTQGEVFYITEALAQLEGLERGPAGNTSLAAACVLAAELPEDEVVVVQETEYTGAGKHPTAQLQLAQSLGVTVCSGRRDLDKPGQTICVPETWGQLGVTAMDLERLRRSYLKRAWRAERPVLEEDLDFWAADLRCERDWIQGQLTTLAEED